MSATTMRRRVGEVIACGHHLAPVVPHLLGGGEPQALEQEEDAMIYPYSTNAALAAIRRVLKAGGYEIGKITGRYPNNVVIAGWNACRAGCSSSVFLIRHGFGKTCDQHPEFPELVERIRARGIPLDNRGWVKCRYASNRW